MDDLGLGIQGSSKLSAASRVELTGKLMPPLVCGHCHYSQAWPEIRGCLDSLSAQACEMGAEIIVAAGDGRGLWFLLSLVLQLFQRILPCNCQRLHPMLLLSAETRSRIVAVAASSLSPDISCAALLPGSLICHPVPWEKGRKEHRTLDRAESRVEEVATSDAPIFSSSFYRVLPLIMYSVVLGLPYFSTPPRPQEVLVSLLPSQAESELFSYTEMIASSKNSSPSIGPEPF